MVEHKNRPLLEGEPPEGPLELVAVVDGQDVGRLDLAAHRQHPDLDLHASPAPGLGVALVGQDPVQPGFESVGVAKRSKLPPGGNERGLHRVVRSVGVAQDPKRDRHALVADQTSEGIEGLSVAPSRTFDERSCAPDSPSSPRPSDGITLERRGQPSKVQISGCRR